MAVESQVKKGDSDTHLLQELQALSQSLYQSHPTKNIRPASFALPQVSSSSSSADHNHDEQKAAPAAAAADASKFRSRRMSFSPWRSRPKPHDQDPKEVNLFNHGPATSASGKKGMWNWKTMRALTHIGMQKLSCLFSVEVDSVQGLPASMNGLRLSVCVRKQETKDGAVHTMPSKVSDGAADFEETLFIRCHVYAQQLKFEPRSFLIYVLAVDTDEIDFGRSSVDLTRLIQESIAKSKQGTRIRQWETRFKLEGKAKGAELVLKLGFQIMQKNGGVGVGIYSHVGGSREGKASSPGSSSAARKQSKTSFSIPSPKLTSKAEIWTPPSKAGTTAATGDIQIIDHLNLDEPVASIPPPAIQLWKEPEPKSVDLDLPEFEVVDRGVEIEQEQHVEEVKEEELTVKAEIVGPQATEVKEMVQDGFHLTRLTELDAISGQIKALESLMGDESWSRTDETESQTLDDEEDAVTREFLQRLEDEDEDGSESQGNNNQFGRPSISLTLEGSEENPDDEVSVLLPDLGKGLGSVVQTRNGGYLAAMNPFYVPMRRKDTPKIAMQLSKPFVLTSYDCLSGFELFQRMAAIGRQELSSELVISMPMDDVTGKTADQVAFEGIASAIVGGRNKEGASCRAARTMTSPKLMAAALSRGRSERLTTGIWNVSEDPLTIEDILAFSMQKMEAMSIDALKIQAEMSEEDAPFHIFPHTGRILIEGEKDRNHPLASAVPLEDWIKNKNANSSGGGPAGCAETITMALTAQLRDPLRRYEAVGGPVIALIQATEADRKEHGYSEEKKFRVISLHLGGIKVQTGRERNVWDTEKQRLTATQWLAGYGFGKAGRKVKAPGNGQDLLWSLTSRVMAGMWLKSIRNPDVYFTK